MNKVSIPIAAICLCTIAILAGIGLFITHYRASYPLETITLGDFQVENLSVGISEYTLTGTFLGEDEIPFFDLSDSFSPAVDFLTTKGIVQGRIGEQGFTGGHGGNTSFYISGTMQKPLLPGSVTAMYFAGKKVEFAQ